MQEIFIKLKEANLGDLQPDFNRIKSMLRDKYNLEVNSIDHRVLVEMPSIIRKEITEMTVVGNTAMHHLFLKLPVNQLGLSPFVLLTNESLQIKAREIGINITAGGYNFLPPPIAGFVGSDHLAMILATEIYKKKGNYLGIDIGTNTEIALKSEKAITSVSTASGPAFKGAHIKAWHESSARVP